MFTDGHLRPTSQRFQTPQSRVSGFSQGSWWSERKDEQRAIWRQRAYAHCLSSQYCAFLHKYWFPWRTAKVCCCTHQTPLQLPSGHCNCCNSIWCWMCSAQKCPIGESFGILPSSFLICTQYDILPFAITSQLQFVTSAMHVYSHQWACQLTYNLHLLPGLGLTDGEGTKRQWSRL